jgi:hypothetical protein
MAAPQTSYILIDHENVHSLDPGKIAGLPVKVLVFLGKQTTKLAVADVRKLLEHPGQIELITISGQGKNVLDFHIAYYAGRISAADPHASIHIISRDKGFDPLIAHLKTRAVLAQRSERTPDLRNRGKAAVELLSAEERVERVTHHLVKIAKARPRRRETLSSSIAALFGKQLGEHEVVAVIAALEEAGKLMIDEKGVVSYRL